MGGARCERRDALEEIVGPFRLKQGFIGRTPRGRVLTMKAFRHLGVQRADEAARSQAALFDDSDVDGGNG